MINTERLRKKYSVLQDIVNKQSAISAQVNIDDKTVMPLLTRARQLLNENVLIKEKDGMKKLSRAIDYIRRVNRSTSIQLEELIDAANSNSRVTLLRVHDAVDKLDHAQAKADEMILQIKRIHSKIVSYVKDRSRLFYENDILPNIGIWSSEYASSNNNSVSMFHPKRTGIDFAEGYFKYLQSCIESKMAVWCEKQLVDGYIIPQIQMLYEKQDANIASYKKDILDVRSMLNLSDEEENILFDNYEYTTMVNVYYKWIYIDDLSAQISTWILSAHKKGKFLGNGIEEYIISKIKKVMDEKQFEIKENVVASIGENVSYRLYKAQTKYADYLNTPIEKCRKVLSEAQKSINLNKTEIQSLIANYSRLRSENICLTKELDTFEQNVQV
jgi:hypothetical protein